MVKKAVSTSSSSTTNKVKKIAKNTTTTKSLSGKNSTAKKTTKTSKKTASKKTASKKTSKSSTTNKSTTSTTEPTTTELTTSTEPTTVELSANDDTTTTEVPEKSQHLEAALKRTEEMYDELIESFDALVKQNKALLARAKRNKKQSLKELNSLYNKAIKEKKPRKNRKPSGFAKATPISDELCNFLNVPKGSKVSRTTVTKKVTKYITEKNLQNPKNRKEIILDDALSKIVQVDDTDTLTYFNIQKFITSHFLPLTDTTTESTTVTAV